MKNFIFKSEADFHKIVFNKLDMVLAEQRHARQDLFSILKYCRAQQVDKQLQQQVDKYFEDDETSHQTDIEDKRPPLSDID